MTYQDGLFLADVIGRFDGVTMRELHSYFPDINDRALYRAVQTLQTGGYVKRTPKFTSPDLGAPRYYITDKDITLLANSALDLRKSPPSPLYKPLASFYVPRPR